MIEALITNFPDEKYPREEVEAEQLAFMEEPLPYPAENREQLRQAV